jgi:hypothetical protein
MNAQEPVEFHLATADDFDPRNSPVSMNHLLSMFQVTSHHKFSFTQFDLDLSIRDLVEDVLQSLIN